MSETPLTEREVIELGNATALQVAMLGMNADDARQVIDSIHRLTAIARRAPAQPSDADVQWALRHDPLCYAAYHHGRQEAYRTPA